jgi:TonB-dependent SusC/RagA subfamily outer membrane receptor
MKKLLFSILILRLISLPLSAQQINDNPLIIINGEVSDIEFSSIDPSTIESMSVLKDQAAIDFYGQNAKYGVISIKTKDNLKAVITKNQQPQPLILFNGVVYTSGLESIDPNEIKSVTVLKDESATCIYGDSGKNGVIQISTK